MEKMYVHKELSNGRRHGDSSIRLGLRVKNVVKHLTVNS